MSTDQQLKGDSFRRQVEASERYAAEHGLELDTSIQLHDIGVSAFRGDNLNHGTLGKFVEAARRGEIARGSALLVESFDRLTRQSVKPALGLLLQLGALGIDVVTLSDRQVYRADEQNDAMQLLLSIAIMQRAYEESAIKSDRVGAAWANKRKRAHEHKLTRIAPLWLQLSADRKQFDLIPERVEIVQRIFAEAAMGCGSNAIAKRLNERVVPVFGRGVRWNHSYITKILSSRTVLGEYQPHRMEGGRRVPSGEPVVDYYPAIIDRQIYDRVQHGRHMRRERGGGRKGALFRNLFTGLAKCGYCGSSMRFVNKGTGPKGGTYLQCVSALSGEGCVSTLWRYDNFEASFLLFVREVDINSLLAGSDEMEAVCRLDGQIEAQREVVRQRKHHRDRALEIIMASSMEKEESLSVIDAAEQAFRDAAASLDQLIGERTSLAAKLEALSSGDQELVARMNALGEDERYLLRTQIAGRLRDAISSLRLEVIGPAGHKRAMRDYLPELFKGEATAAPPRKAGAHPADPLWGPRFEVCFANGLVRTIEVSRSDPTVIVDGLLADQRGDLFPLASDGAPLDPLEGSL